MIYQQIQGAAVPALGFGTYKLPGEACREGVLHALSLGYRHLDTAQLYDNEGEVGAAMAASGVPRDQIFLTTKVLPRSLRRQEVLASTRESLTKLRTDYVDLLLVHWPDPQVPLAETLGAFAELQRAGAARHVGVSNFPSRMVTEAQQTVTVFTNQVEYHPFLGQKTLLEQAAAQGFLLTAYSPIARGRVADDPALQEVGASHGKTPAQVTLRWLVQQPGVAAIPKAASAKNRASNVDIFDFELSHEEMGRIFALARGERLVQPANSPVWDPGL